VLDILRRTVGAGPHFFRLISDNLRSITYCLLWNNIQRERKNISQKCDMDKELELRKCLILNDIAKNYLNYKFIGNIIQEK
jgi:hypothetical protein